MIFYYSATGNSYWVAKELAEKQGEQLISVTDELKRGNLLRYKIREDETIGFVFPVHAWNPPDTMRYFIQKMRIEGYAGQYVFSVATCGDSCGYTMKVLEKALSKKGLPLSGRWEMPMPNNYLPMQDIDSADVEREKLEKAAELIERIGHYVSIRSDEQQLIEDRFKNFKTSFIGFFFRHFGKNTIPFYVTANCTGCGLCEKICKLKKKMFIALGTVAVLLVIAFFAITNGLSDGNNVVLSGIDLSHISDGSYTGTYEHGRWTNTLTVHVENNSIIGIDIDKDVLAAGATDCSGEVFRLS